MDGSYQNNVVSVVRDNRSNNDYGSDSESEDSQQFDSQKIKTIFLFYQKDKYFTDIEVCYSKQEIPQKGYNKVKRFDFPENEYLTKITYQYNQTGIYSIYFNYMNDKGTTEKYQAQASFIDNHKNPSIQKLEKKGHQISDLIIESYNSVLIKITAHFSPFEKKFKDALNLNRQNHQMQLSQMFSLSQRFLDSQIGLFKLFQLIPNSAQCQNQEIKKHYTDLKDLFDVLMNKKNKISLNLGKIRSIGNQVNNQFEEIKIKYDSLVDKQTNTLRRFNVQDFQDDKENLQSLLKKIKDIIKNISDTKEELEEQTPQQITRRIQDQLPKEIFLQDILKKKRDIADDLQKELKKCENDIKETKFNIIEEEKKASFNKSKLEELSKDLERVEIDEQSIREKKIKLQAKEKTSEQIIDDNKAVEDLLWNKLLELDYELKDKCDEIDKEIKQRSKEIQDKIDQAQNLAHEVNLSKIKEYLTILIVDESGSMNSVWKSVVQCIQEFMEILDKIQNNELVTVILFDSSARYFKIKVQPKLLGPVPNLNGGGTSYIPALEKLEQQIRQSEELEIWVVFFTDGAPNEQESVILKKLEEIKSKIPKTQTVNCLFIAFGYQCDKKLLQKMSLTFNGSTEFKMNFKKNQYVIEVADIYELTQAFSQIAQIIRVPDIESITSKLYQQQKQLIEEKLQLKAKYQEDIDRQKTQFTEQLNKNSKNIAQNQGITVKRYAAKYLNQINDYKMKKEKIIYEINDINSNDKEIKIKLEDFNKQQQSYERKLQELKQEEENKLKTNREYGNKKEEEILKQIEDLGFYQSETLYSFNDNLIYTYATVQEFTQFLEYEEQILQILSQRIKKLIAIFDNKQSYIQPSEINTKLRCFYNYIVEDKNQQLDNQQIIKLVLQHQLKDVEFEQLEMYYDRIYPKIDLSELSLEYSNDSTLQILIDKLIKEVALIDKEADSQQNKSTTNNKVKIDITSILQQIDEQIVPQPQQLQEEKKTQPEINVDAIIVKWNFLETKQQVQQLTEGLQKKIEKLNSYYSQKQLEAVQLLKEYQQLRSQIKNDSTQHKLEQTKESLILLDKEMKDLAQWIDGAQKINIFYDNLQNKAVLERLVNRLVTLIVKIIAQPIQNHALELYQNNFNNAFTNYVRQVVKPLSALSNYQPLMSIQSDEDLSLIKEKAKLNPKLMITD